ncbi:MBL fold metallo-hydrolase [Dinghuibacter silviterrae]|uniref:L-ascorbate metabolism protein UlaG (Beta-lactamase superfamily) n=1 Tax=Dinghuibacter silviterrae TaxID=1539049 RepID=A0A4R8DK65_9BACT|nr:MBL fold metallo-hydrolase [Dinghuibacter silviterrae]TDW97576.1 L-ascorbate metabolism protein UlaG (beta-lactamase superfamily) [Dinghuibacter silviterrae]
MSFSVFGATPKGSRLDRMRRSPRFRDGVFDNPEPTDLRLQDGSMAKIMREYFFNKPKDTVPSGPLPVVKTDLTTLTNDSVVWLGHSSYIIKTPGLTLAVDPVLSAHASPVPFVARAFPGTEVYTPADLPELDVLVLTHDHYDHLDMETVRSIKAGTIVTALGVGAHLEYWGIPAEKIVELDLGESYSPREGVRFTATPARHFSGRLFKRNGTLWMSLVLSLGDRRLFLGGDSGYGAHFAQIGETYGPFDLAFLECGQYGVHWPFIHMFPEQTWQAAKELRARALMPVHWGKFSLSMHAWDEPVRRLVAAAGSAAFRGNDGVATSGEAASHDGAPTLVLPRIGQPFPLDGPYPADHWWETR